MANIEEMKEIKNIKWEEITMLELRKMSQDEMIVVDGGRNMSFEDGSKPSPESQRDREMRKDVGSSAFKVAREIFRVVTGI